MLKIETISVGVQRTTVVHAGSGGRSEACARTPVRPTRAWALGPPREGSVSGAAPVSADTLLLLPLLLLPSLARRRADAHEGCQEWSNICTPDAFVGSPCTLLTAPFGRRVDPLFPRIFFSAYTGRGSLEVPGETGAENSLSGVANPRFKQFCGQDCAPVAGFSGGLTAKRFRAGWSHSAARAGDRAQGRADYRKSRFPRLMCEAVRC